MKFVIIIAFAAIIAAAYANSVEPRKGPSEEVKKIIEECRQLNAISDEEFEKAKVGGNNEVSENVLCFAKCFQEKSGLLKDGVFQEDVALAKLTSAIGAEKAKTVLDKCKGVTGKDECETAYKMHQCYKENKAY